MSNITNNTYFKGEILISQAKPSISDDSTAINEDFEELRASAEEDCLIDCLGNILYREFKKELDYNETSLIKENSDLKWGWLLNGHEYTTKSGTKKYWNGIRVKKPLSSEKHNYSFLAFYIYTKFEERDYIRNTSVGHVMEKVKNAEVVSPRFKVVNAWNNFQKLVEGVCHQPVFYESRYGFGVDYFNQNRIVTLYEFITDMNELDKDTYKDFQPKRWGRMDKFGIV